MKAAPGIEPAEVQSMADAHTLIRSVEQLPRGYLRIETGLSYPDGGEIDLFLARENETLFDRGLTLTDFGRTTSWLLSAGVKLSGSQKRKRLVADLIAQYGVKRTGGAIERPLRDISEISEGVLILAQACLRLSDLTFIRRLQSVGSTFQEEVEGYLDDSGITFERNVRLVGLHANPVRVDFLAKGSKAKAAILTLSASASNRAHSLSLELFSRWYDLRENHDQYPVTLLDDGTEAHQAKASDLERLREYSKIIEFSKRDSLVHLLAA